MECEIFPCCLCKAPTEDFISGSGPSPLGFPWDETHHIDVDLACKACEVVVSLSAVDHRALVGMLRYDKRAHGSKGRALVNDYPPLTLLRDDRLEPCIALPNIGNFEGLSSFPVTLTFWRKGNETRCRHRLPLWDPSLGITVRSLALDDLHVLYLGIFNF
jgi:hypothetical protein